MKCTIILRMHALIAPLIALDRVKIVKIDSVVFELKWGRKLKLCRNWTIFIHLAYWRSETDWNITILISAG